jgi:hypothetical protein
MMQVTDDCYGCWLIVWFRRGVITVGLERIFTMFVITVD